MAVDQSTGDVLAIDIEAGTLSRYHEDGTASNFSCTPGPGCPVSGNTITGLSFGFTPNESQVAVDNSGGSTDGNIYVAQGSGGVQMFDENGNSLGELTESSEGALAFPCGVAVDPSGNVYVDDFSEKVHKYEPAGAFPVKADNKANFLFSEGCTIAAGAGPTEGFIFPAHYAGPTEKLDSTTGAKEYVVNPGAQTTTVSVDPSSGHVFTVEAAKIKEYDASGASSSTEVSSTLLPTALRGIAVNGATGSLYAAREELTKVEVFAAAFTFGSNAQPTFTEAAGMAVDQSTGDVLAIDIEAGTLSRYHEDGTASNFSCTPGPGCPVSGNTITGLSFGFTPNESQVAVDNSGGSTDGNIYVAQGSGGVQMFDENGNSLGELTESSEGALAFPCGVAVDPSGNVYVDDFSEKVHKYEPAGAFPVKADNKANFLFSEGCTIAAGAGPTEGFIFPAHYAGPTEKLDSTTGAKEYVVNPGAQTTTVSVDPSSGHVFTVEAAKIKEYDASGASSSTEVSSTLLPTALRGIAVNGATGSLYAAREELTKVEVFVHSTLEFELTVSQVGTGTGTVECEFDGGGFGSCANPHPFGTEVTVKATADPGSELAALSGTESASGCAASPCTFTLKAASAITAEFNLEPGAVGITSLKPSKGPTEGGNTVEIEGANLNGAESVKFGSTPALSFTVESASLIKATAPPGSAGTVNVSVKTPTGESVNTPADDYTYVAKPSVTALSPAKGPLGGAITVTITGANLENAEAVKFGATAATVTEDTATQIKVTAPSCSAGALHVTVTTAGGTSSTGAADEYTCVAAPAVSAVSPSKGPTAGAITVTITGTNLEAATSVKFGATAATITEDTATQVKATAPSCSAGALHVTVTTPGGTSTTSAADEYTCVAAPTVTSVSPAKGPLGGGETVTITGTNLSGAEAVKFGPNAATITEDTATLVKVTAPSCIAGALHVTVTTPGGTSATGAGDEFTCVAAPTISGVSPAKGPDEGGNAIEIAGLNLSAASKVEFGSTVVTSPFLSNSATKIKVKAPAHAAGKVDVKVTTVGGTSSTGAADEYAFVAPPVLTIQKAGSGSGSVSCDAGACKASYVFGTKVTLAATADAGSSFTGFSGGCSGTASCPLTLEADTTVTATFAANPPSAGGGGSTPAPAPAPTPTPTPKPLKCKKGFKKKKVHGKARCVKQKKRHRHGGRDAR